MNEFGYAYGYGHEKPARGGAAAAAVYSPYAARVSDTSMDSK